MGETVKGIVQDVRESGSAYGFILDSTGKYNTYSVFKGLKPKEGTQVEFERELYKPAEGDSPYNRWNITKGTLKISQEAQQVPRGNVGKSASKGDKEFRTPQEMNRRDALEAAVSLIKGVELSGEDLNGVIRNTLEIARHFTFFLSAGRPHETLNTKRGETNE
jgi:hypothetical protein